MKTMKVRRAFSILNDPSTNQLYVHKKYLEEEVQKSFTDCFIQVRDAFRKQDHDFLKLVCKGQIYKKLVDQSSKTKEILDEKTENVEIE